MNPDEMEHLIDALHEALEDLGYEVNAVGSLATGTAEFQITAAERHPTTVTVRLSPTYHAYRGDSGIHTPRP